MDEVSSDSVIKLKSDLADASETVDGINKKMESLENQSRRSNIVVDESLKKGLEMGNVRKEGTKNIERQPGP